MFRRLTQFYDDSFTFPPFRVNDEADAPDTFDRMKTEFLKAGWKKVHRLDGRGIRHPEQEA